MTEQQTILVVDDDFDVRDSIIDVLTDEGYAAIGVGDGIEALQYLRSHPLPKLILLDWMMPRLDGSQFRIAQLQDSTLAAIPVVVITADNKIHEKPEARDVVACMKKPVDLNALLGVVKHQGIQAY